MRRVVLDSNVLVSALATPFGIPGQIYHAWIDGKFECVCSEYIVREFTRIATTKLGFDISEVIPFIGRLYRFTIMVNPEVVNEPRVPRNDRPILGTAVAGYAEILVTGDKELIELKKYGHIVIITPREFFALL